MSPENKPEYFNNFEPSNLPEISWQEMFQEKKTFSPGLVLNALREAELYLTTAPGSNLERRKVLAPEWFGHWKDLLQRTGIDTKDDFIAAGDKFVEYMNLKNLLWNKYRGKKTGITNVAGAEGHKGHVFAAKYMSDVVPFVIWAFEQESYMAKKTREGSFLKLPLRLGMWFFESSLTHLTVLPEILPGVTENDHYNSLFVQSGANYFFVHEEDPNIEQKLQRGEQDLDRTIRHPFADQTTTSMVERFMPDLSISQIYAMYARVIYALFRRYLFHQHQIE